MMRTDNSDIARIIKDQHNNSSGAPELIFDDNSQNIIAVPAGKAKDTGMPEVTSMGTDVFYSK